MIDIRESKRRMEELLSKAWEVDPRVVGKDGQVALPRQDKIRSCLRDIDILFSKVANIFEGKNTKPIKDQLSSIKYAIENISEDIESAYLIPSRQFLVEQLNEALDIIEEQDKEMDRDESYYYALIKRLEKKFGEEAVDEARWEEDDEDDEPV